MDLSSTNTILEMAGGITTLAGAWYSIQKILNESKKAKKREADRILEEAKNLDLTIKTKLESRVDILEFELKTLKETISKEIDHVKEVQASEIKNLAEKIERLREDLSQQHGNLVSLLTRLIEKD